MIGTDAIGAKLPVRSRRWPSANALLQRQALAGHRAGRLDVRRSRQGCRRTSRHQLVYQIASPASARRFTSWSRRKSCCQWATLNDLKDGIEPERMLERGDSVAVEKQVKHEGQSYWQSVEDKLLPVAGTVPNECHIDLVRHCPRSNPTRLAGRWAIRLSAYAEPPVTANRSQSRKLKRRTRSTSSTGDGNMALLESPGVGVCRPQPSRWGRSPLPGTPDATNPAAAPALPHQRPLCGGPGSKPGDPACRRNEIAMPPIRHAICRARRHW